MQPGIHPTEISVYVHKNMYMHIHSSIIYDSLKLRISQTFFYSLIDALWYIHTRESYTAETK